MADKKHVQEKWRPTAVGFTIGAAIPSVCWAFPISIAMVAWYFEIDRPFGDIMCLMIPVFVTVPILGAGIGWLIEAIENRKHRSK